LCSKSSKPVNMKVLVTIALVIASASASPLDDLKWDNPDTGIFRGHDAKSGQFPFQVRLYIFKNNGGTYLCGGTLISNSWVLTAAHCFGNVTTINVGLGSILKSKPEIQFNVSHTNVITHPNFRLDSCINDIALIRIPRVNYIDSKIQRVQLPTMQASHKSYTGNSAYAVGWGDTLNNTNPEPEKLQYTELKVISFKDCRRSWPNITPSQICVSTLYSSTCCGDSGGPLIDKDSKVLIGVTSFGHASGLDKGIPAVFTRVTSFLMWINSHINITL
ncbi:hypothetical protein KR093_007399, partial [Drosophila rubida]